MWGTQTPKKGLAQDDEGVGSHNLVRSDSHENKVYDEPYTGKKNVFNGVAYIHYDKGLLQEERVEESEVKVNHLC